MSAILDAYAADESPRAIARMLHLPVATVRRVLHVALSAEITAMLAQRSGLATREEGYRLDKLARQLAEIDKALKRR